MESFLFYHCHHTKQITAHELVGSSKQHYQLAIIIEKLQVAAADVFPRISPLLLRHPGLSPLFLRRVYVSPLLLACGHSSGLQGTFEGIEKFGPYMSFRIQVVPQTLG